MIKENLKYEKSILYLLFGSIYFVQGIALAYFQNFNKSYLSLNKIDEKFIGTISGILLIPFLMKIFIGVISDHYPILWLGKRKPYILIGLLSGGVSFLLAGFVPPNENLVLFSTLIVIGVFSIIIFDASVDGLAIDSTNILEHGKVQGIMIAGRSISYFLFVFLFTKLSEKSNYDYIFQIITISMILPIPLLFFNNRNNKVLKSEKFQWTAFRFLWKPEFLLFSLYAILYSLSSFGVDSQILYFFKQSFDLNEEGFNNYDTLRGIGVIIGAVAGWKYIDRLGHKRSSFLAIILLSIGAFLISISWNVHSVYFFGSIWGIAWGFQEAVFLCLSMDIADIRISATMFAITVAISNIGSLFSEFFTQNMIEFLDYRTLFQFFTCLNLPAIIVLFFFFHIQKEKLQSQ